MVRRKRTAIVEYVESTAVGCVVDGTVEVAVTREDDWVRLTVTDDGPGIPPAEIDVVTGETDSTQLTHSSGLGLWLVRWMVDSYGGAVSFSRPATGGSRVEIRLEVAPSESADASSEPTDAP